MAQRILIILAVIAVTAGYAVFQKRSLETQLVPMTKAEAVLARLPSASFERLDGSPFVVDDFYQNERPKLVVVHYWGTWCGPCEAELPELLDLVKRYSDRPEVRFLLVAVDDEKVKVEKHLKTLALPVGQQVLWLLDNKKVHRDAFGTTRVPETFVFSSDKATLRKYVGPQQWNKPMFFQNFDDFLKISQGSL